MKLLPILAIASLAAVASPINRTNLVIQEETRWHGWIPSGQMVEVNNIYGNVRAEPATGEEIEVIATKRGLSDPAQVSIEVVEHKGGVTICAVYPDADSSHPFDCRPSHGGGFRVASTSDSMTRIRWENGGGGDVMVSDLRVDFVVRLPKRLRFIGRTVDGDVSRTCWSRMWKPIACSATFASISAPDPAPRSTPKPRAAASAPNFLSPCDQTRDEACWPPDTSAIRTASCG